MSGLVPFTVAATRKYLQILINLMFVNPKKELLNWRLRLIIWATTSRHRWIADLTSDKNLTFFYTPFGCVKYDMLSAAPHLTFPLFPWAGYDTWKNVCNPHSTRHPTWLGHLYQQYLYVRSSAQQEIRRHLGTHTQKIHFRAICSIARTGCTNSNSPQTVRANIFSTLGDEDVGGASLLFRTATPKLEAPLDASTHVWARTSA